MPKKYYEVNMVIDATVKIQAENKEEAYELAHELEINEFDILEVHSTSVLELNQQKGSNYYA